MRTLIYNAIRTPDGTLLESHDCHDYRQHADANGKTYMIDGGRDYIRCSDNGDEVSLAVYLEDGHDKVRDVMKWGNRGKDGKQPLKWVALKDMESSHIAACLCTQPNMKHDHRISMENEITYRETLCKDETLP